MPPHHHIHTHRTHSPPCQMGIQQLRLEGHQIKDNLMLLQIKLHRLDTGLQECCKEQICIFFSFYMTFTTRHEQDPVLHHPWNKFLLNHVVFTRWIRQSIASNHNHHSWEHLLHKGLLHFTCLLKRKINIQDTMSSNDSRGAAPACRFGFLKIK